MALRLDPITGQMVDDDVPQLGLPPTPRTRAPVQAPGFSLVDRGRTGLVNLLGGDTAAPGFDPSAASRRVVANTEATASGLARLGSAYLGEMQPTLQAAQGGLLNLLGAQRAQPGTSQPAAVTAPSVAAPPSGFDYSAETLGNWAGVTPPTPSLVDAAVAPAPAAGVPARQTSFDMANTDRAALAQRAAPTAGINFGFGGGGETAEGYLARMAQQDQNEAQATNAAYLQRRLLSAQSRVGNADSLQGLATARAEAASLAPLAIGARQGVDAAANTRTQAESQLAQQALQSQQSLLGQQANAQATLQAAQIRAGGGVAEAQLKAQLGSRLEILKAGLNANTPEGRLATLKAEQVEAALEAGDLDTATALMGGGRAAQATFDPVTDPVTGRALGAFNTRTGASTLYDDEQLRAGYRASLINANRGQ